MKKNIKLGSGISMIENTWRFNNTVAKKFDKHVNQSIPFYKEIQTYVTEISDWFIKDDNLIYDLGCSTGQTIEKLIKRNKSKKKLNICGYDVSQKMVALAKKRVLKLNNNEHKVKINKKDVLKVKLKKNNLTIAILLTPFLSYSNKQKLFNKVSKSLNYGGAFILIDKVRSKTSLTEEIFTNLYFDFKLNKNLNSEEILNKSKSLRGSMYLEKVKDYVMNSI